MLNATLKKISLGLGVVLFTSSFQVTASNEQENKPPCHSNKNKLDNEVKTATPIIKLSPTYPKKAAQNKQEGWVRLSYVVKEDGSVDLPIIEDSSGIKSFEKAAKRAVKAWTFDPATRNGKTIEQCKNSVQLDFKMKKTTKGASRRFVKHYRKVLQLINEKELNEAKQALNELAKKPRQNFYEDKYFFSVQASYFQAKGNNRQELANLKKLIPTGKYYLPKDSYVYSITRAFQLALLNNELSSTLYFYDKLNQFDPNNNRLVELSPYIDKIHALINSSEHIFVAAQINERKNWNHYLSRKNFSFTDIEGKLNSVDVRCDNHFSTYAVDSEKQWNIPSSWGKCQLFVKGEQGVKFNLVELAAKRI
jgi:TonB family protein